MFCLEAEVSVESSGFFGLTWVRKGVYTYVDSPFVNNKFTQLKK
jgi:hypothetical protein